MESIEEILNPTKEADVDEVEDDGGDGAVEQEEGVTGETTQVAAEKTDAEVTTAQIKAELSALAQERARIRQKEAALDEERARLAAGAGAATTESDQAGSADPRAELKELRKKYREALIEGENQDDLEAMEDRIEELRFAITNQTQQSMTAQERAANDFNAVYAEVHEQYPFLSVDHPQVNDELNADIRTYYEGLKKGKEFDAAALRKAVERFAPAYAKTLVGDGGADKTAAVRARKDDADRLLKEKLGKSGFSEVRSVGRAQAAKPFSGPTPMESILGKTT